MVGLTKTQSLRRDKQEVVAEIRASQRWKVTSIMKVFPFRVRITIIWNAKCMIARGYRVVDLPKCDRDKISDNLMSKLSGKQRKPTEDACYVPITDTTGNVVYPSKLSSS